MAPKKSNFYCLYANATTVLGFIITPKEKQASITFVLALVYILVLSQTALKLRLLFSFDLILSDHNPDPLNGMILFSGLSRFSGHFGGDGPSPLNRDTTVMILLLPIATAGRSVLS